MERLYLKRSSYQNQTESNYDIPVPSTTVEREIKRAKTSMVIPPTPTYRSCIEVFPEELWELILDEIHDSVYIQNVFSGFPELDALLHGRKTNWLFDQVFPHIVKQWCVSQRQGETVLQCRLVCQRWCKTVDEFLQNHPSRRPYNQDGINRRNISYGEITYLDEIPYTHNFDETDKIIKKCESDFTRNPFFSRRVSLWNYLTGNRNTEFLDACILLLQKYGHYIHDLELLLDTFTFQLISEEESQLIILKILKCLFYVPNIRHLTIEFSHDVEDGNITENLEASKYANFPFPALPHLMSLDINGHNSITIGSILSLRYNNANLRKLGLPIFCLRQDKFKYLIELTVDVGSMGEEELQFYPLSVLDFPLLRKLCVKGSDAKYNITQLFSQLTPLAIEELRVSGCEIVESPNLTLSPIPSIKYFRISDSLEHGFDFVRAMTSLQHMCLDWHDSYDLRDTDVDEIISYCRKPSELTNKLRRYMYQAVVPESSHVWNELPTLKLLTVAKNLGMTQYARECGNKPFRFQDDE